MGSPINVEIDCSDMEAKMGKIRDALSKEKFEKVMASEFKRIGTQVRKIAKDDIPKEYNVKKNEVGKAVGSARTSFGGGVNCSIPIKEARGHVGGRYPAKGGVPGWRSVRSGRYKIKSKIVKGKWSTLPETMKHQGGNPPFINTSAGKLHGVAFTRKTKNRFPIVSISGLAIPQMPLNKSQATMEKDIMTMLDKRMDHVFDKVMQGVISG